MTHAILFVCLGNICRSPLAHGVFRALVDEAGLADRFSIESVGTGGWHVGNPPDRRAVAVALHHKIDISDLRAQQVKPEDFYRFDYIVAMDQSNFEDLQTMKPKDATARLAKFLSFGGVEAQAVGDVPDPYYGGEEGFEHVYKLVDQAARGLLSTLT